MSEAHTESVIEDAVGKPKASKKKKDPNAPRGPSGPYVHYQNAMRSKVRSANQNLTHCEVVQEIAKQWKGLTDEEKKPYHDMFVEDKRRYEREMEEYLEGMSGLEDSIQPTKASLEDAQFSIELQMHEDGLTGNEPKLVHGRFQPKEVRVHCNV